MEQIIDLSAVKRFYKGLILIGVQSYRTESHHWVEMKKSVDPPEDQIKLAMSQGATEIVLLLEDAQGQQVEPVYFGRCVLLKDQWSSMQNNKMAVKMRSNQAIDVSGNPTTKEGYYILDDFFEEKDYCDAFKEEWILSIGISYATGLILASIDATFYQNEDFECLFLR